MSGTTDDPEDRPGDPNDSPAQSSDADRDDAAELSGDEQGGEQSDTDAAWQEIVAELSDLSTKSTDERTTPPASSAPTFDFPTATWVKTPGSQDAGTSPRDWQLSAEAQRLQDAEGEFVPPDPTFELSADRLRNLGWFGVIGAPLVAAIIAIVWDNAPAEVFSALALGFLAAAALLIWRLPRNRDHDESNNGGAVVEVWRRRRACRPSGLSAGVVWELAGSVG